MAQHARIAALRGVLVEQHLDVLVVTSAANIRYLTGFSGSNAIVVVSQDSVHLVTDFRYRSQAGSESGHVATVVIESVSLWDGVWAALAGSAVVGFESAHLTHRDFQRLQERADRWHWRPTTELVETLRATKDVEEVALIREAGRLAMAALDATLAQVKVGLSELEVCGILEHELRCRGSAAHPFPPIVSAGERTALPHGRATDRVIARGEFLLIDFGATVGGYCSDITRTVVMGAPSERQREVHGVVRKAQEAAFRGLQSGHSGREADKLSRRVIDEAGFGELFGHGLGHGIGLEVHEAPRLSRLSEGKLLPGMVVTIEPGVYVPDWGGVRIEDDALVLDGGIELLTEYSRELLQLD